MANKNKLSIYMIKDEFENDEAIIGDYSDSFEAEGIGTIFLGASYARVPKWAESFFVGRIETKTLFTANARAALIVRIAIEGKDKIKTFVITMGYGKHMLKDDVIDERFGLKVILNTIQPDSLRRISKVNVGGNQKLSNEQLPLKAGINDFGLDINRDLVSHIAGISDDAEYAVGTLSGGDILTLTTEVDISNIVEFLKKTYEKYCLSSYKTNFGWVDQIQAVKDSRLIERLNEAMITEINVGSSQIWMAVPEIINWDEIHGFKYPGQELRADIVIQEVKDSFRQPLISVEQLRSKRIQAISALDDSVRHSWGADKCLYGELLLDNDAYCINNGKWYRISKDFVEQVNRDYSSTNIAPISFDDFTNAFDSESAYSLSFKNNNPNDYVVMDAQNLMYGGGHSKIELCDLLSKDKQLIHIKPYSGSSTLSHLFNQALVSADLMLSDSQFRELANEKILEVSSDTSFAITNPRSIKIVFGIISKKHEDLPHLPFFSKVSFRHVKNRLQAIGFDVSIKTIRDMRTA